jgi:hypothetical protein
MVLPEALVIAIIALGVGLGTGILTSRKKQNETLSEDIKTAVSEAMTSHLGTGNGEIKEDIAAIKAFITVSCPSTHKLVDKRLDVLEKL